MNLASMQFQKDLLLKTKLERLIKRFDIFSSKNGRILIARVAKNSP